MIITKVNVRWSKTVKWLSYITGFVLIFTIAFILINDFSVWSVLISLFILALVVYVATFTPLYIELNDTGFVLHKLIGRMSISYDQIKQVDVFQTDKTNVRIFGSGGFLGYTGTFYNKSLGMYKSYVGNYNQTFMVVTKDNKKYVFSCENRDLVIINLKKYI